MASSAAASAVKSVGALGFPFKTQDPFLFCVYHKDLYPVGNASNMFAPRKGNGADFDWSAPYRMYHGERIPGFPQHPHRGFETLTLVQEGVCDHTDSLGAAGRYGGDGRAGDMQVSALEPQAHPHPHAVLNRKPRQPGPRAAVDDGRRGLRARRKLPARAHGPAQHATPLPDLA